MDPPPLPCYTCKSTATCIELRLLFRNLGNIDGSKGVLGTHDPFSRSNFFHFNGVFSNTLLAMIALSAVQSSVQTFIHNAILFIDVSNNAWYNKVHWLIKTPYLSVIANNDSATWVEDDDTFRSTTEHFFFKWTPYFTHDPFIVLSSLNREMFPRLVRHSRSHS